MQMTLKFDDHSDHFKKVWAFAKDKRGTPGRRRRKLINYRNCIITACSKEAKRWGVRAGMRYEEAKSLLPEMRILVIGDKR